MLHPGMGDGVRPSSLAHRGLTVEFRGQASHAAGAPWRGVNALDTMLLGFSALGLLRQQIEPSRRVHGVITHGGDSPNIIPERTAARLLAHGAESPSAGRVRQRSAALSDRDRGFLELRNKIHVRPEPDDAAAVRACWDSRPAPTPRTGSPPAGSRSTSPT